MLRAKTDSRRGSDNSLDSKQRGANIGMLYTGAYPVLPGVEGRSLPVRQELGQSAVAPVRAREKALLLHSVRML